MSSPSPIVFVVDDDPALLKSLSRLLKEEGWLVETYDSAEAFLARRDPQVRGAACCSTSHCRAWTASSCNVVWRRQGTLPIVFLTGMVIFR